MFVAHSNKFFAHGNYTIDVKDNLINVSASGAWNLEAKQDINLKILSIVKEQALTQWYIFADVSHFELGTPEFQREGLTGKLNLIENGLKKVAYINNDSSMVKLRQIAKMQPKIRGYKWRIFKCPMAAKLWLYGLNR